MPTGILSGTVRDSGGLVIQGATIRATSQTQESIRVGVTNSDGSYSLTNLVSTKWWMTTLPQALYVSHHEIRPYNSVVQAYGDQVPLPIARHYGVSAKGL